MPKYYNPNCVPDASEWLQLDEQSRIFQVEKFHKKSGICLPNAKAHAAFHVVVENQIAQGEEVVIRAILRLERQGLTRHDCIHAACWVLAQHVHEQMTTETPDIASALNERYFAEVERLQADQWLALFK
jgi:hypothetical protein